MNFNKLQKIQTHRTKFIKMLILIIIPITIPITLHLKKIVLADTNNTPTIDSVYISSSTYGQIDDYSSGTITPNSSTIKTIHINGTVSDDDGESDIASVNTTFYKSEISNQENCSEDNNNCYKNSSCSLSYVSSTTQKYNCQIDLQYFIDSTDESGRFPNEHWITHIKVIDTLSASSTDNTTTKEIASVLSLNIPSTINYGTLNLGDQTTSENNIDTLIIQQGNTESDIMVSGENMICSEIGSIPLSNQKWSIGDIGYSHPNATPLTSTPTLANIYVGYLDDDSGTSSKSLYWNIGIATSSLKGTCSSTSTITAIAH